MGPDRLSSQRMAKAYASAAEGAREPDMPEPVLVAIAAALAGKAATSLYELVKRKLSARAGATEALTAAEGAAPESPAVVALAHELERAERDDPGFATELRAEWATVSQQADRGGVANQITGPVTGNVVQARDIEGGVSF